MGSATPSPDRPRQRRQADPGALNSTASGSGLSEGGLETVVLDYLDRPVQFVVMRIGNASTNSAPRLLPPPQPLEVTEDTLFSVQLEYTDAELDSVDFELLSVSKLANVSLSSSGYLTYDPCLNCIGTDVIYLMIRERPIGENHTPLEDYGQLVFEITNENDNPLIYFFQIGGMIIDETNITTYIDSNRITAANVASIAAFDFDGYNDDLQLVVLQDGQYGSFGIETRLYAVNTVESLPGPPVPSLSIPNLTNYHDYVAFLGSRVTYLPFNRTFVGRDEVEIAVRDAMLVRSVRQLRIVVEVLPSPCENDGVCGGSDGDPTCEDIGQRRTGFSGYNCSCLPGFTGELCEIALAIPEPPPPTRGRYKIYSMKDTLGP